MELHDDRIRKYARKITFLTEGGDGSLRLPSTGSDMPAGDAQLLTHTKSKALTFQPSKRIDSSALQPIGTFTTEHTYSMPQFFKPSVAEIISQLPEDVLEKATAVSVRLADDGTLSEDGERHRAEVTAYTGEIKRSGRAERLHDAGPDKPR